MGTAVYARESGTLLYVLSATSRETTRELGGWKLPEVMERVHREVRSKKRFPKMRAAVARSVDRMEMEEFLKEPEAELPLAEAGEVGLSRAAAGSIGALESWIC